MAIGTGAIIGGVASVGAGVINALMGSHATKERKKAINRLMTENGNEFASEYFKDATQSADNQRLLTKTMDSIRNANRNAQGVQAVMGGTDEASMAAKEANAEALANTMSAMAANAEAKKSALRQDYLSQKRTLEQQKLGVDADKASQIANATQGLMSTGLNMVGDYFAHKED